MSVETLKVDDDLISKLEEMGFVRKDPDAPEPELDPMRGPTAAEMTSQEKIAAGLRKLSGSKK